MDLAHGATILHGDDVVVFAITCAIAALVLGGMWFAGRRRSRKLGR
ncbi:MAG TPA: hypothetical protein VEV43_10645 [Actinomycetota bacterium]|nr:hypothetical protein [Actinomycetota bacterium]